MFLPCDNLPPGESMYFRKMDQEHEEFTERLRKSLYFGQLPGTDRPSLPLTDLAVRYYQDAAPKELGKLDHYWAASTARAACMTPSSMVAGMMYVKRLKRKKSDYLSQISSSDLFLISVMMASKFLYDEGVDEEVFNDEWATSGNLDVEDVNELEREFLSAIDWELFVQPNDFKNMLERIEKRIALEQGLDRGWFSYTDLELLMRDFSLLNLSDLRVIDLAQVFGISTFAYLASILTMISSTILATTASSALVHFGSTGLAELSRLAPVTYLVSVMEQPTSDELMIAGNLEQFINELNHQQRNPYCNQSVEGTTVEKKEQELAETDSDTSTVAVDGTNDADDPKPKTKDSGQFLSGFLSPFLALVTLKDTIMKFSQTLIEKEPEHFDDNNDDIDDADDVKEFCSDGPCLLDSWPNCWNFSSGHDWSKFKSQQARESAGLEYGYKSFGYHQEQTKHQAKETICCCKNVGPEKFIKHGLHFGFMDSFNIGFSTSSAFPIFVT